MKTILTQSPETAAEFIRRGGIVAFPTETVYGLGADAFDAGAIERIFAAKDRPPDNPLIAHIGSLQQVHLLAGELSPNAKSLIEDFFPGPLTVVVRKVEAVPHLATAGLETVGIRMPANTLAREFLTACGRPVVAPSANLSGRPSPTTWRAVLEDLDGRIDCILQGDNTAIGLESTVVDCTRSTPLILRKGAVTLEQLRAVVPDISEFDGETDKTPRSPGMKHKHYSPRAKVLIVSPDEVPGSTKDDAFIGLHDAEGDFGYRLICAGVDAYAREVFEFFRESDRRGMRRIFCEAVSEAGIGAALMDRIRRAAEA